MSETVDPPVEAPVVDAADDLRSALGDAWDEVSGGDTDRDERGRFANPDAPAEPEAATTEPEAPAEAAPAVPPPATLGADDLSRWATLPRDAQEFIAQREAKAHEAVSALEPVQRVLKQYEPLYAARGIPAPQAMASLFQAQHMLETRPHEAIAVLARQYGVALPTGDGANLANGDQFAALMQEVQQLRATVQEREVRDAQASTAAIETTIKEFATNPEHRHFPVVRSYMGALMQADPSLDMGRAYEMACRAHPEVSKALSADAEKAERAKRSQAANEARSKAVSVRGGAPPVNGAGRVPDSIRGVIESAWSGSIN